MENPAEKLVYADFNGVDGLGDPSGEVRMSLTGYGTLASLNFHRI